MEGRVVWSNTFHRNSILRDEGFDKQFKGRGQIGGVGHNYMEDELNDGHVDAHFSFPVPRKDLSEKILVYVRPKEQGRDRDEGIGDSFFVIYDIKKE